MQLKIIFIYCLCDEILKANRFKDDPQSKMTSSEVMTTALTAALFFQGNYSLTLHFVQEHRYFLQILSLSRFCKKIHKIPATIWMQVIFICRCIFTDSSSEEYIVDSFPVPVCLNCRIFRCKLFSSEAYRGYCSSKKSYFFGIKVHMIVSKEGIPAEFIFTPGLESDITALKNMDLDLPEGLVFMPIKHIPTMRLRIF